MQSWRVLRERTRESKQPNSRLFERYVCKLCSFWINSRPFSQTTSSHAEKRWRCVPRSWWNWRIKRAKIDCSCGWKQLGQRQMTNNVNRNVFEKTKITWKWFWAIIAGVMGADDTLSWRSSKVAALWSLLTWCSAARQRDFLGEFLKAAVDNTFSNVMLFLSLIGTVVTTQIASIRKKRCTKESRKKSIRSFLRSFFSLLPDSKQTYNGIRQGRLKSTCKSGRTAETRRYFYLWRK